MVSIKDISVVCGVSVATVSKALNNYKDVGEETKARICQTAREMGYVPNFASKVLKTNRTYNLGVLFKDESQDYLMNDYFSSVLDSFREAAEDKGYDITFINGRVTGTNRMRYLEHCKYRRFDGVVMACADFYDQEILELVRSDIPLVTIDHVYNNRSTVISDNVKGMRALVEYIYRMGHRRIAYIHGTDSDVTQRRLSSFYKTCEDLGVKVPAEYVREAAYRDTTKAWIRTMELLRLKERPTCIIYPDDFAYIGGLNAITESGLKVPDDISTAGYDGIALGKYLAPPLTTLEQDTRRLGLEAANMLISIIEHPRTTLADQVLVEGKLFEGGSVKRLQGADDERQVMA